MYSSQPEESTSTNSEAVIAIPVVVLPFHALANSTQVLDRARLAEANRPVQNINVQFLAGPKLKLLAHAFGNDHLKLGGDFNGFHGFVLRLGYRYNWRMSTIL